MLAILQVADTGPLDSLIYMLQSVGISCALPDKPLRDLLRTIGCDTVLEIDNLIRSGSYEPSAFTLPSVGIVEMQRRDIIIVDVKAQKNYSKLIAHWPHLADRVLWYRINGGRPEHVINARGDHGDEVNPPCPVLTPNQWYSGDGDQSHLYSGVMCDRCNGTGNEPEEKLCQNCDRCWGWGQEPTRLHDFVLEKKRAYACWPPFVAIEDYVPGRRNEYSGSYERPICLVHNLAGWGYQALADKFRELGVALHGEGSPDRLLKHREIPVRLSKSLAYVHLKSSDAPGYALYEALAAGCPVICTRRLIWRCRMQELLIPNKTCLVFDRETHDPLTVEDVVQCEQEVRQHLTALAEPGYNKKLGDAGRAQLQAVMWNRERDAASLASFMERNYGYRDHR